MKEKYIKALLKESNKALKTGNIPVGALIVKDNKIISKGFNKKETTNIITDHAEIIAINKACKKLKTWRLNDCILYTTLKPCSMCLGAIIEARITTVFYLLDSKYYKKLKTINKINFIKEKSNNEYKNILIKFFDNIR